MTTPTRPFSHVLAPALLGISALLVAWNWVLRPDRVGAWGVTVVLLSLMAIARGRALRWRDGDGAARRTGDDIMSGIVFGGLMLAFALAAKLAGSLGVAAGADLSQRAAMIILGAFFVFTGNALPKTLTPMAAMRCDPARTQAFQRLAGWTWVLTGLGFSLAWLVLPAGSAENVAMLVLIGGMLSIAVQVVRLRRSRHGAV